MNTHDDITGFGALNSGGGSQEMTLSDNGQLSPLNASSGHGGSTGDAGASHVTAPPPTPVSYGGLTIWLVWDASVSTAGAVKQDFENTVIAAATTLVDDLGLSLTNPTKQDTVYIDVGWGEINGQGMSPSALGESETNGDFVSDSTVNTLLSQHLTALDALNDPANPYAVGSSSTLSSTTQFFLPTAEGRALGYSLASASSLTSPDGYIGISTLGKGIGWQYTDTSGNALTPATSTWYSLYGDALHELSEAMGRISMEGLETFHGHKTYTPLDLFDYAGTLATNSTHALSLSNTGGYFSADGGVTASGNFNNAKLAPGDIADWASKGDPTQSGTGVALPYEDAFNAYGATNLDDVLSNDDILLMQVLGY